MKDKEEFSGLKETFRPGLTSALEYSLNLGDLAIRKIFNNISVGIIILNYQERKVLFTNEYFESLASPQEKTKILENLEIYFSQHDKKEDSQDLEIMGTDKKLVFNFTTHRLDDHLAVVFLSEVSSDFIFAMIKQENLYFNKLNDLIAEMAHEIGNPLSGISTSLQVLLYNLSHWSGEKVLDYIERTIDEISRLSEFLKRMREVSDDIQLSIKSTNLKRVIDKVLRHNEDILKEKRILLKNNVEPDIQVFIDEGAFYQIVLNLLNNSLNILSPGQEIGINVDTIDNFFVKLEYRNNGEAIPGDMLEKIFSPLYFPQIPRKGLGLHISLKLMTRMGGTIKALPPEDGIGVKFVLYIPKSILTDITGTTDQGTGNRK